MKKTYWWRITVLFLGIIFFGWGYLVVNAFDIGVCVAGKKCFFNYKSYIDPLMYISLSILTLSPFLFFVQDIVFLKWLKFAIGWLVLAAVLITFAPVYSDPSLGLNPTKESISIWMGSLLVIISLIQLTWLSKNNKPSKQ